MKKIHLISVVILIFLGVCVFFVPLASTEGRTSVSGNGHASAPDATACVQPPSGMTNWYAGDGNAIDLQTGLSASLRNGAAFGAGKVLQAFSLDGVNDHVELGDRDLPDAFTIDAWINPSSFPNAFPYILNKDNAPARSYFFALDSGRLRLLVGNAAGGFTQYQTTAAVVTAGTWHFVAVTYDGNAAATQKVKFYRNGVNLPATVLFSQDAGGTPANNSLTTRIGIGGDGADRPFAGLIDEVEIFGRVLSPAELLEIFVADSDGKCKGPVPTPTPGFTPLPSPTPSPSPSPSPSPTPSPTPTQCTYELSPERQTTSSAPSQRSFRIETGPDCFWQVGSDFEWLSLDTSSGFGAQNVTYTVAENTSENARTGAIALIFDMSVRIHIVQQLGKGACPVLLLNRPGLQDSVNVEITQSDSVDDPQQFYEFRDTVLAKTTTGDKYTEDYYRHAGEITKLMILNPTLFFRSKDVLSRYRPVVESVLQRERAKAEFQRSGVSANRSSLEPTIVYNAEIDDVTELLGAFAAESSGSLRDTLHALRNDIRDPQVQAEFGVRVVAGVKRPLPGEETGLLEKIGGFSLFDYIPRLQSLYPIPPKAEIASAKPALQGSPAAVYGKIPLSFEANKGQVDESVRFLSRGAGYNLFLTGTEAVISIPDRSAAKDDFKNPELIARLKNSTRRPDSISTIRMKFDGANPNPRVRGRGKIAAKSNYFVESSRNNWRTGISNYSKVEYDEIYRGIDLVYYGNQRQLEYDFKVAPGADPSRIKMNFEGADRLETDKSGDLILQTKAGEVRVKAPIAYQVVGGIRKEIPSRYLLDGISKSQIGNASLDQTAETSNFKSEILNSNTVGFEIGEYDRKKPLVIDPVLVYSTYLGGSGEDNANGITIDAAGNAYIIGFTDSTNFPLTGAIQANYGGNPQDIFVSKINAAGNALVYSTYLGGSGQDNGSDIAVDSAGNAYITGYSGSTNFPVANALQPTRTGLYNAFVAKLNPTGSQLLYSTYYGGTTGEYGASIAVDATGNAYVAGVTSSADFPDTVNAFQTTYGGSLADSFVTKFNAAGNQVVYSSLLGGNGNDGVTSIAVDAAGNAYLTGVTFSTNFPTVAPLQASFGGGAFDGYVTKINPTGTAAVFSTYLGGSLEDRGFRVELDAAGNVYVAGMTQSTNFPVASALQSTLVGGSDAFVTKLTPTGAISYSTFLGGSGLDGATGLAVSPAGGAFVTGFTSSANFPVVDPSQTTYGGGEFDAFAAKLNAAGNALNYSTYLGGAAYDTGFDIDADAAGNAYVLGRTSSVNFPVVNPFQATNRGSFDVFVTKLFAPNLTLAGRVTTPSGQALRNATVALTDFAGARRTATTSSFGIYSFADVRGGENYVISVSSKRYRFAPRSMIIDTALTNVDFVGLE